MAGNENRGGARTPRYNYVTVGVLFLVVAEGALGLAQWLRFFIMRTTIRTRMRAVFAEFRARGALLCLCILLFLCSACGTGRSCDQIGWTVDEIVLQGGSFDNVIDSTQEILLVREGIEGPLSVFDETIFYYRDAAAVLDTLGEIFRSSDEGLRWTIDEILRS